jgi:hypothetical protein
MSQTAIADASWTLLELLRTGLPDVAPERVNLISPADVSDGTRLSLFLYALAENAHLRNQAPVERPPDLRSGPPLDLDLYYLLTCYPPRDLPDLSEGWRDAHALLARAMHVLNENAAVPPSRLQGSLAGVDGDYRLRIILQPLTIEDMSRIWEVFPSKSFTTSVSYLVTPVAIDGRDEVVAPRVVERRHDHDLSDAGGR